MYPLTGVPKSHDWGSVDAIPGFLGQPATSAPVAELWFGAHPSGSSGVALPESDATLPGSGSADLRALIEADPRPTLGPSTIIEFGDELPYLVKLIAPAHPLSLQVHPGRNAAARGFAEEDSAGVPRGAFERVFQDPTHRPEMIYAISQFDGLVGFAPRREARERLDGLRGKLAARLDRRLLLATGRGVKPVVSWLLDPEDGPRPGEVAALADECKARLENGWSPDPLVEEAFVALADRFGPEPATLIAVLMNHLRLEPGHAAFVPTRTVHAYLRGLGLEVMANSDNVVRAGLTSKHVDVDRFMEMANFDGAPPTRIAPEHPRPGINRFRSPVEDFELVTATPSTPGAPCPLPLPGSGPRVAVALSGPVQLTSARGSLQLEQGEAAFLPDADGTTVAEGPGTVAVCLVP